MAAEVRHRAGLDDFDIELAPDIAVRVLGQKCIALIPGLRGDGYLQEWNRGGSRSFRILVRPGNSDMNFTVAHELGHWALRVIARFSGDALAEERAANYVGAAILAPPRAVRAAHNQWGERRLKTMARAFAMSQTAMVLRLAEVLADERAVVTQDGGWYLRTIGGYAWDQLALVDIVHPTYRIKGLAKATLRGGIDEGRVALRAM